MSGDILIFIGEGRFESSAVTQIKESVVKSVGEMIFCESLKQGMERLNNVSASNSQPKAVLIGTNISSPATAARQIHQAVPNAQIIFLVDVEKQNELQRDLRFASLPGTHWTFGSATDAGALIETIKRSVQVARQRRQLRTTLDKINLKISRTTGPAQDGLNLRRLVISDRYLASILTRAQDAIVTTDLQGKIISANDAAADSFRYTEQKLIGENLETLVAEQDRGILRELIHEIKTVGADFKREFTALRTDGTTFDVEMSVSVVKDEAGKQQLGMVTIVHDISGLKQRERRLAELLDSEQEARRKAEEADNIKNEFLATVSHELRTPLNAIIGWASLLRNGKLDADAAVRAVEAVERNARAQSQLIEDLLDISRIITGKLHLKIQTTNLAGVVESAVEALRPAADAKEIRLETLLDTKTGPIACDPDRLQQVFWNLLSNAVKFTPEGGRVQIKLERVNSHVEITVSDTGAGIKPEFLHHVFDRFRQADQTITRRQGGLGLGLSIARQLVEMHGGVLRAHSEGEGKGTSFVVELPKLITLPNEESRKDSRTAPKEFLPIDCAPELTGLRILIVDDEADARELLREMFEMCGSKVTTTGSAVDALTQLDRVSFDVLISDIGMPGEDGYTLINKVRLLPSEKGGGIPAVALTAHARAEDRERALTSGFQVHISKPFEAVELIAVVVSLAGVNNTF